MSLVSVVDPTAVRSTAVDVVSDLPPPDGGPVHVHAVAELHRYVDDTITYDPDPGPAGDVAPPAETLETERGNHDCQAVLLASLLAAVDAPTRLVRCESVSGDRHVVPEVSLAEATDGETSAVAESLGEYYDAVERPYDAFCYEVNDDRIWYPVDPAMSRYVGDLEHLSINEFVHGLDADGSWSWHDAEYRYPD